MFCGQGASLRSLAPDSTVTFAPLVAELGPLQELGLQRVTLPARSAGITLVHNYPAEYPDRVRQLVLIGPTLPLELAQEFRAVGADTARFCDARQSWERMSDAGAAAKLASEDLEREPRTGKERTDKWRITSTGKTSHQGER